MPSPRWPGRASAPSSSGWVSCELARSAARGPADLGRPRLRWRGAAGPAGPTTRLTQPEQSAPGIPPGANLCLAHGGFANGTFAPGCGLCSTRLSTKEVLRCSVLFAALLLLLVFRSSGSGRSASCSAGRCAISATIRSSLSALGRVPCGALPAAGAPCGPITGACPLPAADPGIPFHLALGRVACAARPSACPGPVAGAGAAQ